VNLHGLARLVRAPAALTVPGDNLAGAAAAGRRPTLGLAASSVCLYWAGMALNDYADREVDATERPQRPIPSGQVSPAVALGVAVGLTGAGVALAAAAGGAGAVAIAVPLAGVIWAYDLRLKSTAAGPLAMAAARTLDVLMGAGIRGIPAAAPTALTIGAHTAAITALSRREVEGASPALPAAMLAATVGIGTAAFSRLRGNRVAAASLLATYVVSVGQADVTAMRDPAPKQMQRAVGAGILGMMPLQAALTAGSGAPRSAIPIAAAFPLARRLARRVSTT